MAPHRLDRILAFEDRFAKAQATDVIELSFGYALLNSEYPHSYTNNRVVVADKASSAEILSAADEVLGGADLDHRYVTILDQSLGDELVPDFVDAGFTCDVISLMIHDSSPVASPAHVVRDVPLDVLRPALIRDWSLELPGASDDVLDQLADRGTLYPLGADVARLAVFADDQVAARGDVFLDREDRIGQFESLVTHADYRGRGYGQSLLCDALRRGQQAGCELFFLTADVHDWPIEWYRRMGFVDTTRHYELTRTPG